jgi:septal ring-binding cell division protein DamX
MKQSTKRLTSSIVALALLLASFVILLSFIQPAYKNLSELRGEIASREDFANSQAQIVDQVQKLIEEYQNGSDNEAALSLAFPRGAHASEVVGQLNGILAVNNLTAQSFQVAVEEPPPKQATPANPVPSANTGELTVTPLRKITTDIKLVGTYENLKNFIQNVQTNIRIMDMTKLEIAPALRADQDLYTVTAKIVAYFQPEN